MEKKFQVFRNVLRVRNSQRRTGPRLTMGHKQMLMDAKCWGWCFTAWKSSFR